MLLLSAQGALDKGQQMAITRENALRMMSITSSANLSDEDFPFFRNHISSFNEWLVEQGINDLVRLGIDRDLASSMLNTISHISSMAGATNLFDYGVTATIFEQNGLTDNA
jgi:hypothetical protein